MVDYEQLNIKLRADEMAVWKAQAEKKTNGNITAFLRNCVQKAISNESQVEALNLERENRKLDALAKGQAQVIDLLQKLLLSQEKQRALTSKMAELARNDVDQVLIEKVLADIADGNPATAKAIAKKINAPEVKVLEALTILETEGKVKRNFLVRPNTFEVKQDADE